MMSTDEYTVTRARFQKHDLEGHPKYTAECKLRAKFPAWLKRMWDQAKAACLPGKIPILVIGESGCKKDEILVVMKFVDLLELEQDKR